MALTTNMALPIGHSATNLSTVQLCIGKPFRQAVNLPDAGNYSRGMALWLLDSSSNIQLFAMFSGSFRVIKSGTNQPYNILRFEVGTPASSRLSQIRGVMEPTLKNYDYVNIDITLTTTAIQNLIKQSYLAAGTSQASWHPILRVKINGQSIKTIIDNSSGQIDAAISTIVQNSINNSWPLAVNAGDMIGAAGYPLSSDTPPAGCTFTNPRFVTVLTEEYALNRLNPTYYLWVYLKSAFNSNANYSRVSLLTVVNKSGNTFAHPLLNANGLNIDLSVKVLPRITYQFPVNPNVNVVLFPVSNLLNWHGHQFTKKGVISQSAIQWRIDNASGTLYYATQITPGGSSVMTLNGVTYAIGICGITSTPKIDVCVTPNSTTYDKTQATWAKWQTPINIYGLEFQYPGEYIIAAVNQESAGTERALACEVLKPSNLSKLNGQVDQDIIDAYNQLTNPHGAYGINVPNPIPLNSAVQSSKSTLTWSQLFQIVDVDSSRVSPGLTQTLVSTARGALTTLQRIYTNFASYFNVAPVPTTDSGLFQWLLVGSQSLLVSVYFNKMNYVNSKTALDLPLVDACYNAGSINMVKTIGKGATLVPNPWLMRYNDVHYPLYTGRSYNAVKDDQDPTSGSQQINLTSQIYQSF